MIEGIQIKVCGLTSPGDAESADAIGADYLGFNFYPKSPRGISLEAYRSMSGRLPKRHRVAVVVEPDAAALQAIGDAGIDLFQIHFRHDFPVAAIEAWSKKVGPGKLWLAPKVP